MCDATRPNSPRLTPSIPSANRAPATSASTVGRLFVTSRETRPVASWQPPGASERIGAVARAEILPPERSDLRPHAPRVVFHYDLRGVQPCPPAVGTSIKQPLCHEMCPCGLRSASRPSLPKRLKFPPVRRNTAIENSTHGHRKPTRNPPRRIRRWRLLKDLPPLVGCRPTRGWAVVTRLISPEDSLLSRADALLSCKYSCAFRSLSTVRIQRERRTPRAHSCDWGVRHSSGWPTS